MLEILITAFATYGFSYLLVYKDGFGDILYKLRSVKWLKMLLCMVCTATWVAVAFSIVYGLGYAMYLLPFAIVAVVALLEEKL